MRRHVRSCRYDEFLKGGIGYFDFHCRYAYVGLHPWFLVNYIFASVIFKLLMALLYCFVKYRRVKCLISLNAFKFRLKRSFQFPEV